MMSRGPRESTHPANTPPSSTSTTLRPSFHQNIGPSGGASGSTGAAAAAFATHSDERFHAGRAVDRGMDSSLDRAKSIGMAETPLLLFRGGIGGRRVAAMC